MTQYLYLKAKWAKAKCSLTEDFQNRPHIVFCPSGQLYTDTETVWQQHKKTKTNYFPLGLRTTSVIKPEGNAV